MCDINSIKDGSIIRLCEDNGTWVHFSKQGNTIELRRLALEELNGAQPDLARKTNNLEQPQDRLALENRIKNCIVIRDGSIIRLCEDNGTWVHFSKQGNTVKLRRLALEELNGAQPDSAVKTYKLAQPQGRSDLGDRLKDCKCYSMQEANEICSSLEFIPSELSARDAGDRPKWELVIQCIKDQDAPPLPAYLQPTPIQPGPTPDFGRIIIPQTKLRRFYETLRLFGAQAIHQAFADYRSSARRLERLFNESVRHFACYKVPLDPMYIVFYNNKYRKKWNQASLDKPKEFAKCLQARLKPSDPPETTLHKVIGRDSLDFYALDYEISPRRTPDNAIFEDGHSGKYSGAGGMDLLLDCAADHTPIIGEIKAKGDTNAFLALVQSLMYASELVTGHQWIRLQQVYRPLMAAPKQGIVDIYIIHQRAEPPLFIEQAKRIADALVDPKTRIGTHVRRIAFIDAELATDGHGVTFNCEHVAETLPSTERLK